ncbi:MAG TPA: beta-1,6-N-acetylglucosaminyltransferase [Cyclobacteriaceae bacterium]|nr:beta-1,6-N-acetylglucosaminyltransferase [Cyclobacteriaceae bacterium]
MRVANVFVAHKNPDQLYTLVSQFPPELYENWIHLDKRANLDDYKKVLSLPNVRLASRLRKVAWAGVSFIVVTMDMFREIAKCDEKFMYVNLMSGLDFPIKPTADLYQFLKDSKDKPKNQFFHITDVHGEWPAAFRYEKVHFNEWTKMKGRYFTERIVNMFVPRREYFHGKMVPYGRSAWFTATWEFVDYAIKFFDDNPGYLRFLRTVWCPDELVFSSLVMHSPFRNAIAPGNLRLIDWSEGKANPKVFRIGDFERVIKSDCYLARKFDADIDSEIIAKLKEFISQPKNATFTASRSFFP